MNRMVGCGEETCREVPRTQENICLLHPFREWQKFPYHVIWSEAMEDHKLGTVTYISGLAHQAS